MSSAETGTGFPGVTAADIDRVSLADLSAVRDYRVQHLDQMTTHQIVLNQGGRVVVSVNADGGIGALDCDGECRHRVEGRTLILEG